MSFESDKAALEAVEKEARRLIALTDQLSAEVREGLDVILSIATYRTDVLDVKQVGPH